MLPRDAFALAGYRSNRCYVVPSLDLVVARVGSGPPTWDEPQSIGAIVDAAGGRAGAALTGEDGTIGRRKDRS